jgi:hypothetical protein
METAISSETLVGTDITRKAKMDNEGETEFLTWHQIVKSG